MDKEACESFPGWDFLFSIAYSHSTSTKGSPIEKQEFDCKTWTEDERLNYQNRLPTERRLIYWRRFWELLLAVMPPVWAKAWKPEPIQLKGRRDSTNWLWHIRCAFSHGADPYRQICRRLATYESGCSKSSRARTCRRTRKKA